MRPCVRHLVWLVLAGLLFVVAPQTRAQATLFACFQAMAPLDQAAKAAEIASKAGACAAEASGDPLMAMTIAALTAAAVGKVFSTSDECNAKINGAVGKVVAEALLALPLPGDAKALLTAFINGTTPLTFEEIVGGIPGLNAVLAYIHCGCSVAGAAGDYNQLAKEYAATFQSCASFASDAVGTFLDAVGGVGEDIHHALNGPSLHEGVQQEQTCYVQTLPDGIWTKTKIWTSPTFACNVLRCKQGHVVIEKVDASGKKLNQCAAKCPDPIKTFESGSYCYKTIDSKPVEGICTQVPGVVHCCGSGQKVFEWGKCSPACSPGIAYWDLKTDKCQSCAAGWYPVYNASNSSLGSCKECAAGKTYDFSSKTCKPLNCTGPTAYYDPKTPHVCASCPPGKTYSPATGKCECGTGTFAKGSACVCPLNANKQMFASTFTCACPAGSVLVQDKFACVCPAGQHMVSNKIQGGPYHFCATDKHPVVVPSGKMTIVCPKGTRRVAGGCRAVPPPVLAIPPAKHVVPQKRIVSPTLRTKPLSPLLQCPSGMTANKAGTGCIGQQPALAPRLAPSEPPVEKRIVAPTLRAKPPPLRLAPVLHCPSGTIPNKTGTGCIKRQPTLVPRLQLPSRTPSLVSPDAQPVPR